MTHDGDRNADAATAVSGPDELSSIAIASSEAELPPGSSVGRYIVLSELGAGAMGVVLMAYDPELDRKIALKLLKPKLRRAGVLLRREAQALAKLAHPNVVAVHDVGEHGEQVFVAMEYVEGQTVGAWIHATPPPSWREVLRVFTTAGRGLAAAHGSELVHRDFKPENIMLGDDGRVRVMDFGLARGERRGGEDALEGGGDPAHSGGGSLTDLRLTRTGALTGSPAYMAPEQYRGQADALSDQFSFCVALYEGLYGERPPVVFTLLAISSRGFASKKRSKRCRADKRM